MPALFDRAAGVHVVPIRHHSPACAWHLRALIEAVEPAAILIEGPCDFDALLPAIADTATRPPVAIVALATGAGETGEARRAVSYFPFCAHSPEYVAIRAAAARGIPARFIDLPSQDEAMTGPGDDRIHLVDERAFDSNAYVRALAGELGCRDGNEVWDHLFETRIAAGEWERFFTDVGLYCGHLRACTAPETLEADGTLAREAQMRACIAEARRTHAGPIVAVVGGFHAPALVGPHPEPGRAKAAGRGGQSYLIRYGNRQLNALAGYAAGLPLPGFYERLWQAADAGGEDPFDAIGATLLPGFAAHLRTALPAFAPAIPVLASALENARRLAALRERRGPLRDDILDACRSTFVKDEEGGDAHPIMAELMAWLTGAEIGDVPASAGSPPLVEAARAKGRALAFTVTDGERRNRDLDIYRNERHRRASQFLHAMALLETGFGRRTAGPDLRSGVNLDRLHESWSVAWSPMVEARLIQLSALSDTVDGAVAALIGQKVGELRAAGQGQNAVAVIALFAAACQAGVGDAIDAVLPILADEIAHDPVLASVAEALRDLISLWRNRDLLSIANPGGIEALTIAAWRRALHLVPDLADAQEDAAHASLAALLTLREAIELAGSGIAAIDGALFDEAIAALVDDARHPAIAGAINALACLSGRVEPARLAQRIAGGLSGGYVAPSDKVAFLRGVIAISRELLWGVPELLAEIEQVIETLDHTDFVALLPHLRLAFGQLDPRDIDRIAHRIADARSGDAAALTADHAIPAEAMPEMLEIDAFVARELALAGLA